jgi:hypothetical protein
LSLQFFRELLFFLAMILLAFSFISYLFLIGTYGILHILLIVGAAYLSWKLHSWKERVLVIVPTTIFVAGGLVLFYFFKYKGYVLF